MSASGDDEDLLARIDRRPFPWVVTRTRRLARSLLLRVAERRARAGRPVGETPSIHALEDWIDELGRDATEGRVLLSAAAERALWAQIIRRSGDEAPAEILDVGALAATAMDAWARVCGWGEPDWRGPLGEDAVAFSGWLGEMRRTLAAEGLVTRAELPALVAAAIGSGHQREEMPELAMAIGFERRDPFLEAFVGALAARGVGIERPEPVAAAAPVRSFAAADRDAEVRSVAKLVHARLAAEPDATIAVVACDLEAYRATIRRVFEEELDAQGLLSGGELRPRFDIAVAPALADYALVASALDLLSLSRRGNEFPLISRILLSPVHVERHRSSPESRERPAAGETDARETDAGETALADAAAVAEASLRRGGGPRLRLAGSVRSVATHLRASGAAPFAERIEALDRHLADVRRRLGPSPRLSPSAWRHEFVARLEVLGWPGAIGGDTEGLVFQRWREAMAELVALETVEASFDEDEALAHLRAICEATAVQPSTHDPAVQVLGILDATGLDFDVVFALGATATAFPASPRPNPLLPVLWQREQDGMPRASIDAERELAERVWQRLRRSCRELVATYPRLGEGDEEQGASPVVVRSAGGPSAIVDLERERGEPWWITAAAAAATRRLEPRAADQAPPALVRNGYSSLLSHQSSCPFRAFAAFRLGAEKLARPASPPDAAERGVLVHAALEAAYREVRSSRDLAALGEDDIDAVAGRAAATALAASAGIFEDDDELRRGAARWLAEMVASWMRTEREERTTEWEVVEAEHTASGRLDVGDGLALDLRYRPDRIDRVEGGGLVLVDFKTSATEKTQTLWAGERPDEPQLPLYATLLVRDCRNVAGVAFANLAARDRCSLVGLADRPLARRLGPPASKRGGFADWPSSLEQFEGAVSALARGYLLGDVRVAPKSSSECSACGARALCRVDESGADLGDEDEAPE